MNKEFKLPDVGEGLTEADIVSWHVKPGDTVTVNQIIVDIETAKAVVELPSPYAGTVSALLVEEGQTVDVGTPIIAVDVPGGGGRAGADRGGAAADPGRPSRHAGHGHPAGHPGPAAGARRLRRQAGIDQPPAAEEAADPARLLPGHAVRPAQRAGQPSGTGPAGGNPVFPAGIKLPPGIPGPARRRAGTPVRLAKPPVRRLARDLGVDLGELAGSGPEGSVTRDDVERAAGAGRSVRKQRTQ